MELSGFDQVSLIVIIAGAAYAGLVSLLEFVRAGSLRNIEPIFFIGLIGIVIQARIGFQVGGRLNENIVLIAGIGGFTVTMLGPFLLLLIRRVTESEFGGKTRIYWHFLPTALYAIIFPYFLVSDHQQLAIQIRSYLSSLAFNEISLAVFIIISLLFFYIMYFVWVYLKFIRRYSIDVMSALGSPKIVKAILYALLVASLLGLFWFFTKELIFYNLSGWAITIIAVLVVMYQYQNPDFFSVMVKDVRTQKYANTKLIGIDVDDVISQLEHILGTEKAFIDGDLRMRELSSELGMTNHQFSRIINEKYGKTFHELLNFHRIEEAKRILAETDESITDVLYRVGFNSKSAFNNQFNRIVGMTPSKYRGSIK